VSGRFFYEDAIMSIQPMEQTRLAGATALVMVGMVCSYPQHAPGPFHEEDLWDGHPEETNAAYGLAMRMLLVLGQAYRHQYGFNPIYLLPVNFYGPADTFDPRSSQVIPAHQGARRGHRERGGSHRRVGTGTASREFHFVHDAAGAIVVRRRCTTTRSRSSWAPARDHGPSVGDGDRRGNGLHGRDPAGPDEAGRPRRALEMSLARERIGFRAVRSFDMCMRRTIAWYESTYRAVL
jgi:GDP-L-fucose synthase